jgi:hypothetical protein
MIGRLPEVTNQTILPQTLSMLWPNKFYDDFSIPIRNPGILFISPMSLRNDCEELFVRHGISRNEVCSMTDVEFQKTLDDLLNETQCPNNSYATITSQYRYISPKMAQFHAANIECDEDDEALQQAIKNSLEDHYSSNSRNAKSQEVFDDNMIRDEQDREYRTACEEAEQQTFDMRNQEIFNANETVIAKEQQQERNGAVIGRYYSLPPEPATGTTIAVVVNGERCIRKFDPRRLAADVYSWVAGQTIHCDEGKLYFDEFELAMAGKGIVDTDRTLEDQGMSGRILLQTVPL